MATEATLEEKVQTLYEETHIAPTGLMLTGDKGVFALADVLALYNLAKLGMARSPKGSRVAPRYALAYRRVREALQEAGKLPK